MFSKWTKKTTEEVLNELKSQVEGITNKEAENRLKVYGFNELRSEKIDLLQIFFRQLRSPFFYLLAVASVIAFWVGEINNAAIILLFVCINIFLGFFQEAKAHKAIFLLRRFLPLNTTVIRDGEEQTIEKRFLIPGDIVSLEAGNIAPADLRILKAKDLWVDESVLSGESVQVLKSLEPLGQEAKEVFEAKNIVFAGTSIITGNVVGVVVETGKRTVLGEIAKLVSGISHESAYEKNLLGFSKTILRIILVTISLIFVANLIIKGTTNLVDFLIFSIALIVGIIPEALPTLVTFAFSKGALQLAKKNVVVKRLAAIEDLGSIEILCADKTGTLTQNKLKMEKVVSKDKTNCLLYGLACSSYIKKDTDANKTAFELAIFDMATLIIKKKLKTFEFVSEIPFDAIRRKSGFLVKDPKGKKFLIVKGAPENILNISTKMEKSDKEKIKKEIEIEENLGKRILALAYKPTTKNEVREKDEENLIFLGYFVFSDPLKRDSKKTIKLAQKLGVQIKILTGDSKGVAGVVAEEIGLIKDQTKVILGEELDALSAEEFAKACRDFAVFARVSPVMKYKIIEELQKDKEVGFLGEGINDTPALKIANVSIAVQEAVDVARDVADIILLKKDLSVLVEGIKIGRNIFSNVNKYIKCTMASNFGNFYSIALISLVIPFLPMLPIQILLVNLLSDFPLLTVATDEIDIEELRRPKMYQLNKMFFLIMSLALVSTVLDFIFFGIFRHAPKEDLRTLWFIGSILTEILLIFSIRTSHFFLKTKTPSLPLLMTALGTILVTIIFPFTILGQTLFSFSPPSMVSLLVILGLVGSYFFVSEIVKLIYFKYYFKINVK